MTVDPVVTDGDVGDGAAFAALRTAPDPAPAKEATLEVTPRQLSLGFVAVTSSLVLVHLALQSIRFLIDNHRLGGLLSAFSLGSDTSVPACYSALAILFCAIMAFAIGLWASDAPDRKSWLGLGAIFAFLSVDEMLAFHEKLIDPVGDAFDTSGLLLFAWVIPYGIAGLVFLAIYVPFLRRLPTATAIRFVVAGMVFVSGAIGMEMLGGAYFDRHGSQNVTYVALQTIEEVLEMVGIIIFIHALAVYGVSRFGRMSLAVGPDAPDRPTGVRS